MQTRLMIDGNAVYEVEEDCLRRREHRPEPSGKERELPKPGGRPRP